MKRYILALISMVIVVLAVSAAVYAGDAMHDEYLANADRLRVRAGVETDAAKKEEYLREAERLEQMADEIEPIESDPIFNDNTQEDNQELDVDGEPIDKNRSTQEQDKMKRDYERAINVQERIDKLNCASCRDESDERTFGGDY